MNNAAAATEVKRTEAKLKCLRTRIRRLTTMAPGPARQQERLLIAADLTQIASSLYEIVEAVMAEPGQKSISGPP